MRVAVLKVTSVVLLFLFPCAVMGSESGAMVFPAENVTVNGSVLTQPVAVFAGDRITTGERPASMTMAGSVVQIGPKSALVFGPESVGIDNGGVEVTTASKFGGHARNLTVSPASTGKVRYTVAERDGKVLVAALEGKLALNDGTKQMMLNPGTAISMPVQQDQTQSNTQNQTQNPPDQDTNKKKRKGGAAAGTVPPLGGGVALSQAAVVAIAVASAAAAAGLTYGLTTALTPAAASPVR